MVLLRSGFLYDVSDAVHPRLLCRISNTSAHILTGTSFTYLRAESASATSVVLRSLGSGNESVAAHIPYQNLDMPGPFGTTWWAPDGSIAATTIQPAQPSAGDTSNIWVYSPGFTGVIGSYPYPLAGCPCRFGVPRPVMAISPDHQYLVAGWPFGKGSLPLAVYKLADRSRVYTFDGSVGVALWDRSGHRLYASGSQGSLTWTPDAGPVTLAGAMPWSYLAATSPDASQIAYTAYTDPATQKNLRVFVYDLKTDKTRMLVDALRSQVVFVKAGWVWYLDETACDSSQAGCGPWGSMPSGKVIAMNLADGVEHQVDFSYAEDTNDLVPGDVWP
jgi:hypothetical protein